MQYMDTPKKKTWTVARSPFQMEINSAFMNNDPRVWRERGVMHTVKFLRSVMI